MILALQGIGDTLAGDLKGHYGRGGRQGGQGSTSKNALGGVFEGGVLEVGDFRNDFHAVMSVRSGGRGGFDREICPDAGYGGCFELSFRFRGWGIGGLDGVLRFEPNFGLFPFFLGLYKVGVGPVEGAIGGGLVADEEAEVVGDGDLDAIDGIPTLPGERFALEAESAEALPLAQGHFFDEDLLGGGGGLEFDGEVDEEGFKILGVFACDESSGIGCEAV